MSCEGVSVPESVGGIGRAPSSQSVETWRPDPHISPVDLITGIQRYQDEKKKRKCRRRYWYRRIGGTMDGDWRRDETRSGGGGPTKPSPAVRLPHPSPHPHPCIYTLINFLCIISSCPLIPHPRTPSLTHPKPSTHRSIRLPSLVPLLGFAPGSKKWPCNANSTA
jgi:hypothetical protein